MGTLRTILLSSALALVLLAAAVAIAPSAVSASTAAPKPAPSKPLQQPSTAAPAEPVRDPAREAEELKRANALLRTAQKQYRYLDGVTLRIGPTPADQQAVAYYTVGEIVINPNHAASIEKILAHEVWHIIDWRDNGRLDWGEDLPPDNLDDYRSK
jgi:hypothetical protein